MVAGSPDELLRPAGKQPIKGSGGRMDLGISRNIKAYGHLITGAFKLGSKIFKAIAGCYRLIHDALPRQS